MITKLSIDNLLASIRVDELSYQQLIESSLAKANHESAHAVFTQLYAEQALSIARNADTLKKAGVQLPALYGLPITIKDLYDVAGEVTTSGSVVLKGAAPAKQDAEIVKRIRQAGMAIIGKTNMSEFAFSGVGINPHYGTPQNPCDPAHHRIPGGSSSGAAVSVALGLSVAAIGSDTGGSIRIPAALCGLVGFKSTMRRVPTEGAIELARSLDTVCAMANTVADVLRIDGVLSGSPLDPRRIGIQGLRFAVPRAVMLDDLDQATAKAFGRTLQKLSAAGASIEEIPLQELTEIATINAPGGLSPIESYSAHKYFVDHLATQMDHRVVQRMLMGKGVSAADYLALLDARARWIKRVGEIIKPYDALICPTVPMQAPITQALMDSDDEFFRVNKLLLRNTFAINFLDGCSFSIPMHEQGELPTGLMLSCAGGEDAHLAQVALAVESICASRA
jgi:aspartyl-tRNA(Asn)/glutamyl-tRNA(Gln) amidotransferase subunit A